MELVRYFHYAYIVNNKYTPIATFLSFFNLIMKCMLALQGPVRQDDIYHCAHRGVLVINECIYHWVLCQPDHWCHKYNCHGLI